MVDEPQFAHVLSQKLNDRVIGLQPMGVSYGSNHLYKVETTSGQRYVVKMPKQARETMSPFWQHLDVIFGIDCVTQNAALYSVSAQLQQQAIIDAPQVIQVELDSPLLGAPYVIVTYLDGTSHEPDEFPASAEIHYQLGQYVGYLHTQHYPGYGSLLMEHFHPKADFLPTVVVSMRRTIKNFWADQPALHNVLDKLTSTTEADALFSTANLMMVDISANQFVYDNNRIAGVVDLDAYVIGPREFELAILEMCITQPAAFQQGYDVIQRCPLLHPFVPFIGCGPISMSHIRGMMWND